MPDLDPAAVRERCKKATPGPDADAEFCAHARTDLELALDEIERLKRDGSPGVLHAVDQAFYDLTVKERDYERGKCDRLTIERDALQARLDRVTESFAMAYKGPHCTDADEMRAGAKRLAGGYEVGGSNMRDATARLLRAAADELDSRAAGSRPLPHNEAETRASGATT